ncbi:conserved lipothrix- and rudiviral protein [Sulfolobus islandicus filamentous virus 2]|uniref:Conserved lipothrix-and rudiviral protein n=1 Tax=Sulfolobus islandicus filamentous virus 2 TaxID=1902331 RepID=A0A1D8BJC0_SIFV|nr:conserved lipothrix- and rudiviral protein [Sulfolobus islandicus filamentous virus 2]
MISYIYDEKDKTLHVKIHLLIEHVPQKPSEEELRKVLPKILKDFGNMIETGKIKILDRDEWGLW